MGQGDRVCAEAHSADNTLWFFKIKDGEPSIGEVAPACSCPDRTFQPPKDLHLDKIKKIALGGLFVSILTEDGSVCCSPLSQCKRSVHVSGKGALWLKPGAHVLSHTGDSTFLCDDITDVAATHTEVIGVDSKGRLLRAQWPVTNANEKWEKDAPKNAEKEKTPVFAFRHYHIPLPPLSSEVGGKGKEPASFDPVWRIAANTLRCTALTRGGQQLTFSDSILMSTWNDYKQKCTEQLGQVHTKSNPLLDEPKPQPLSPPLSVGEGQGEEVIVDLKVAGFYTLVLTRGGKVYYWGLLPRHMREKSRYLPPPSSKRGRKIRVGDKVYRFTGPKYAKASTLGFCLDFDSDLDVPRICTVAATNHTLILQPSAKLNLPELKKGKEATKKGSKESPETTSDTSMRPSPTPPMSIPGAGALASSSTSSPQLSRLSVLRTRSRASSYGSAPPGVNDVLQALNALAAAEGGSAPDPLAALNASFSQARPRGSVGSHTDRTEPALTITRTNSGPLDGRRTTPSRGTGRSRFFEMRALQRAQDDVMSAMKTLNDVEYIAKSLQKMTESLLPPGTYPTENIDSLGSYMATGGCILLAGAQPTEYIVSSIDGNEAHLIPADEAEISTVTSTHSSDKKGSSQKGRIVVTLKKLTNECGGVVVGNTDRGDASAHVAGGVTIKLDELMRVSDDKYGGEIMHWVNKDAQDYALQPVPLDLTKYGVGSTSTIIQVSPTSELIDLLMLKPCRSEGGDTPPRQLIATHRIEENKKSGTDLGYCSDVVPPTPGTSSWTLCFSAPSLTFVSDANGNDYRVPPHDRRQGIKVHPETTDTVQAHLAQQAVLTVGRHYGKHLFSARLTRNSGQLMQAVIQDDAGRAQSVLDSLATQPESVVSREANRRVHYNKNILHEVRSAAVARLVLENTTIASYIPGLLAGKDGFGRVPVLHLLYIGAVRPALELLCDSCTGHLSSGQLAEAIYLLPFPFLKRPSMDGVLRSAATRFIDLAGFSERQAINVSQPIESEDSAAEPDSTTLLTNFVHPFVRPTPHTSPPKQDPKDTPFISSLLGRLRDTTYTHAGSHHDGISSSGSDGSDDLEDEELEEVGVLHPVHGLSPEEMAEIVKSMNEISGPQGGFERKIQGGSGAEGVGSESGSEGEGESDGEEGGLGCGSESEGDYGKEKDGEMESVEGSEGEKGEKDVWHDAETGTEEEEGERKKSEDGEGEGEEENEWEDEEVGEEMEEEEEETEEEGTEEEEGEETEDEEGEETEEEEGEMTAMNNCGLGPGERFDSEINSNSESDSENEDERRLGGGLSMEERGLGPDVLDEIQRAHDERLRAFTGPLSDEFELREGVLAALRALGSRGIFGGNHTQAASTTEPNAAATIDTGAPLSSILHVTLASHPDLGPLIAGVPKSGLRRVMVPFGILKSVYESVLGLPWNPEVEKDTVFTDYCSIMGHTPLLTASTPMPLGLLMGCGPFTAFVEAKYLEAVAAALGRMVVKMAPTMASQHLSQQPNLGNLKVLRDWHMGTASPQALPAVHMLQVDAGVAFVEALLQPPERGGLPSEQLRAMLSAGTGSKKGEGESQPLMHYLLPALDEWPKTAQLLATRLQEVPDLLSLRGPRNRTPVLACLLDKKTGLVPGLLAHMMGSAQSEQVQATLTDPDLDGMTLLKAMVSTSSLPPFLPPIPSTYPAKSRAKGQAGADLRYNWPANSREQQQANQNNARNASRRRSERDRTPSHTSSEEAGDSVDNLEGEDEIGDEEETDYNGTEEDPDDPSYSEEEDDYSYGYDSESEYRSESESGESDSSDEEDTPYGGPQAELFTQHWATGRFDPVEVDPFDSAHRRGSRWPVPSTTHAHGRGGDEPRPVVVDRQSHYMGPHDLHALFVDTQASVEESCKADPVAMGLCLWDCLAMHASSPAVSRDLLFTACSSNTSTTRTSPEEYAQQIKEKYFGSMLHDTLRHYPSLLRYRDRLGQTLVLQSLCAGKLELALSLLLLAQDMCTSEKGKEGVHHTTQDKSTSTTNTDLVVWLTTSPDFIGTTPLHAVTPNLGWMRQDEHRGWAVWAFTLASFFPDLLTAANQNEETPLFRFVTMGYSISTYLSAQQRVKEEAASTQPAATPGPTCNGLPATSQQAQTIIDSSVPPPCFTKLAPSAVTTTPPAETTGKRETSPWVGELMAHVVKLLLSWTSIQATLLSGLRPRARTRSREDVPSGRASFSMQFQAAPNIHSIKEEEQENAGSSNMIPEAWPADDLYSRQHSAVNLDVFTNALLCWNDPALPMLDKVIEALQSAAAQQVGSSESLNEDPAETAICRFVQATVRVFVTRCVGVSPVPNARESDQPGDQDLLWDHCRLVFTNFPQLAIQELGEASSALIHPVMTGVVQPVQFASEKNCFVSTERIFWQTVEFLAGRETARRYGLSRMVQADNLSGLSERMLRWATRGGVNSQRTSRRIARVWARLVREMVDLVIGFVPGHRTRTWERPPSVVVRRGEEATNGVGGRYGQEPLHELCLDYLEDVWRWLAATLDVTESQLRTAYFTERANLGRASAGTSHLQEYLLSMVRLHAGEGAYVRPAINIGGYAHLAFILDAFLYTMRRLDPNRIKRRPSLVTAESLSVDQPGPSSMSPGSSQEGSTTGPEAIRRNRPFFTRSTSLYGDYAVRGLHTAPVKEAIPLAVNPGLLHRAAVAARTDGTHSFHLGPHAGDIIGTQMLSLDGLPAMASLNRRDGRGRQSGRAAGLVSRGLQDVGTQDLCSSWQLTLFLMAKRFLPSLALERDNFAGQVADFEAKAEYMRYRMEQMLQDTPPWYIKTNRATILDDGLARLGTKRHRRAGDVDVKFRNEPGTGEGVTRAWFTEVSDALVSLKDGESWSVFANEYDVALFFEPGHSGFFAPRACALWDQRAAKRPLTRMQREFEAKLEAQYYTIGQFVALALANSQTISLSFSRHVVKYILGRAMQWHDLAFYNAEKYESLRKLLLMPADVLASCELSFVAPRTPEEGGGSIALCPNGENIPVTAENVLEYVELHAKFVMVDNVEPALRAMRQGFQHALGAVELSLLSPEDFHLLLNGTGADIDLHLLKRVTLIEGDPQVDRPTVEAWLWEIVGDMTNEDKSKFLYFSTGLARMPADFQEHYGFGIEIYFTPCPSAECTIRNCTHLPSAAVCGQSVTIPYYGDKETMRSKLMYAINHCTTFQNY